ncbi:hydrogenase maturation protein [Marinomonas transparens]|uniref:Hydrogenase maturation protein n=1 Tax=Marinomonas transparens TaxID=2795388 RepID=A0A934MXU2_9GAMM|nr:hydrogenase maturation protein [Marinomonas transparens]MBJ7539679.1 hydrogenase maturation protein [Marinomonas transparens]
MRILFITTSHNGLSQRAWSELLAKGHDIKIQLATSDDAMLDAVEAFRPELILAPFLKKAIPDIIWKNHTCLIVHPGIKGDRGPSSLDWAIMRGYKEWGVTILQAAEEMDAGDIWSSNNFPMRDVSKSNLYRHEVTAAALKGIHDAVSKFESLDFVPEALNYSNPDVKGCWNDPIKRVDRAIDWASSSQDIIAKIKAADSTPGVLESHIFPFPCFMYGAHLEDKLKGNAGEILAQRDSAICIATGDGAIWVSHLKKELSGGFKLPAMKVLAGHIAEPMFSARDIFNDDLSIKTFREIWYREEDNVSYLYFDFYNGAMSTEQCLRLREAFWNVQSQRKTQIIVLMGGHDIWSNGIHLNVIENAISPAQESWDNIVAMDDFVCDVVSCTSHYIISALHGNAGAGGAVMALAADEVIAREGVVFNPHYKKMGLFGSEYWTYLLPKRVGVDKANQLTSECLPVDTKKALEIGLIDAAFGQNVKAFRDNLSKRVEAIKNTIDFEKFTSEKRKKLLSEEAIKSLNDYRNDELREMWVNFNSLNSPYHILRYSFVHKIDCVNQPKTYQPDRLESIPNVN